MGTHLSSVQVDLEPIRESTHILHVDISQTLSTETGSFTNPFNTIMAAVNKVVSNADNSDDVAYIIKIAPGTYTETVTLENDLLKNLSFIATGGNPASGGYSYVNAGVILDPASEDALESEVDNTNLHYLYFKGIRFIGTIHLVGEIHNTLFGEDCLTFEDCGFEGFRTDGVVMTLANLERFTWINGCIGRGAVITAQNIWSMSINGEKFSDWPMDMSGACTLTADTTANMPYHMDDENAGGDQMTFSINHAFVQRSSWTLAQGGTGVLRIRCLNGFMNGNLTFPTLASLYGYTGIFNNNVTMNGATNTVFLYNTVIKGTFTENGCTTNTYASET